MFRVVCTVACHLFLPFMLIVVLGVGSDAPSIMKDMAPKIFMMKYIPLCWSLPVLAVVEKYAPSAVKLVHIGCAVVGAYSALRWYYYYFLSAGSDWLPSEALGFALCKTGACYTELYNDIFSAEALGTHGFCTYDGLSLILTAVMHIAVDGARFVPQWRLLYLVGALIAPEAVFPLFLLHVSSLKIQPNSKDIEAFGCHFWLFFLSIFVVLFPMALGIHQRMFVNKFGTDSFAEHTSANASAIRAYMMYASCAVRPALCPPWLLAGSCVLHFRTFLRSFPTLVRRPQRAHRVDPCGCARASSGIHVYICTCI